MNDSSPVPVGAVEKVNQTTPSISAGKNLHWVRFEALPFPNVFLPKKSDREQSRSLQLTPPPSQFGTQVVVRLVTGRAAVTKISVSFMCVHCLSVSPLQSLAVHADACPGTKRGIPGHKPNPPPQLHTYTHTYTLSFPTWHLR